MTPLTHDEPAPADITKSVIPIVTVVAIIVGVIGPLLYISRKAWEWDSKLDAVGREIAKLNAEVVGRGQFREWLYLTRAANPTISLPNLPARTSAE